MLNTVERGDGPPVVLVHGFTQSAGSWWPLVEPLEEGNRLVAVDAPGHGGSARIEAGLAEGADLMVASVPAPAAWVGYSMGGRFALHAALRHPEAVSRLIVVSSTGGIDDPQERAARRRSDTALAERVESEGLESFLAWWVEQPLFATLPPEVARVEERVSHATAAGLASSLRLAGTGSQEPLWDAIPSLEMPVLVMAGALDEKYVAIARRLVSTIGPNACLHLVAGAGHACHLERPEEFTTAVRGFLRG
ncbi:MAG TPA: alpha/beta fold hydrolase [Acidimicrobiales bacterium]|nr:alpha/beta fold hydrolase [Acidimicrobiales bacterium]